MSGSSDPNTQTTPQTKPKTTTTNNTQGNTAPNIVQSGDKIDKLIEEFSNSSQADEDIESLYDSFFAKNDWKGSTEILSKLKKVYAVLNEKDNIYSFVGEYNNEEIVITKDSIINEIKGCK